MSNRHIRLAAVTLSLGVLVTFAGSAWGQCGMMGGMGSHEKKHEGTHQMDQAENRNAPTRSPHGGVVRLTNEFQFESMFTENELRIYVMDAEGRPVSSRDIEGTVVLQPQEGKDVGLPLQWTSGSDDPVSRNRVRPGAVVDPSVEFLSAPYNFRTTTDGALSASIKLRNLPGEKERKTEWTSLFRLTPLFGMACPMHPKQASFEAGTCPLCSMALRPAYVFYEGEPPCESVRRTLPGKCEKSGMELKLQAVGGQEAAALEPPSAQSSSHSH